ncbi:MAG: GDP-mannose 4,6-dehydratase [Candidatus Omnitrophica bacterium]|nr:GDP-mannose 4,6-dehydratase [Candidatus Omnitrophota bacterium]
MNEKVIIIGSNSFSGSNFVDLALGEGLDAIGISRSQEPSGVFLPYIKQKSNAFKFYQLDINHDLEKIMEVINRFKPDYVVNFAAQSMVGESWVHPEHWFQTNVVACIKLHDQLRNCEFLKKYVHISTPEVYGNCVGLIKEGIVYNPSTPYAVSRAAADMSLMSFYKTYNFPVVFTRAANVYGPGQQLYRIVPKSIFYFLTGKKIPLHGGGQSVRSFIHIRDVVDGILKAARLSGGGEIFHFSTAFKISIRGLVGMIARQMNISLAENIEEIEDRPGKDAAYLLDSSKAKDILGWEDKIGLEQGIEETIAWVRDNLGILKKQPLHYIHKP